MEDESVDKELDAFMNDAAKELRTIAMQYGVDVFVMSALRGDCSALIYDGGRVIALGLLETTKAQLVHDIVN